MTKCRRGVYTYSHAISCILLSHYSFLAMSPTTFTIPLCKVWVSAYSSCIGVHVSWLLFKFSVEMNQRDGDEGLKWSKNFHGIVLNSTGDVVISSIAIGIEAYVLLPLLNRSALCSLYTSYADIETGAKEK